MPKPNTIKEYLVSLGFDVDQSSARKFEDSLRLAGQKTEKFVRDLSYGFAAAGGTIAGVLTAIGTGTLGVMEYTAKADMGYQLFARRMYMTTDAARKMKMATDALGYSVEEIVWGPPELAQRYHQLIEDQTRMFGLMGGDGGERALRKIRDINQQFVRMEPALKIFAIRLTEDIMDKMFDGPASLEFRLSKFVDWFESKEGFVKLSDTLSNYIAPAFLKVGRAAVQLIDWSREIFSQKNVDWVVNIVTKGMDTVTKDYQFLKDPNRGSLIWDKDKSLSDNIGDLMGTKNSPDELKGKAAYYARKHTSDPGAIAEFLALIDQESGFINRVNPNPKSGAIGLGQVMPFNSGGHNLYDPDQNLDVAAGMYFGSRQRHKGNARQALNDYYGHGTPPPGDPTFDQYFDQWSSKYNKWKSDPLTGGGAEYQPQSYQIDVGGIHINQPNATPEQIKSAVHEGIESATRIKAQRRLARRQVVYA